MKVFSDDAVQSHDSTEESLETTELQVKLAECLAKGEEYLQGWQRAKADYANYKKEEAARVQMMIQFGQEHIIRDLLLVIDSFDLALQSVKDHEATQKGILLIKTQFEEVLRRHGVEAISVLAGESLDLIRHEPLLEVNSELAHGVVVSQIAPGFSLHGKVIRPAKVSISKGP